MVLTGSSQNYELVGKLDNHLVSIDSTTGAITIYQDLINYSGEDIRDLTFHKANGVYYSILRTTNSPALVSISQNAQYQIVGPLTLGGNQLLLVESLAYNEVNDKLYAGVSLNGGVATNDFHSETIVEVDPATGNCTFVTELITNRPNPDADVIVFDGNTLYIADGAPPNQNFQSIYQMDITSVGATTNPLEIYASSYVPIQDFTILGQDIYMVEGRNLRKYLIQGNTIQFIGATHLSSEYQGNLIMGLSKREICEVATIDLGQDRMLCSGQSLLLDATTAGASYQWQDGSTNPTYLATQPGDYWVEVDNSCNVTRDSISLTPAVIVDIPDDTLCSTESIVLDATSGGATYLWNDGTTQATLTVNTPGTYWVDIQIDGCVTRDSVSIFQLGYNGDIPTQTICPDEDIILDATTAGASYTWNNGSSSSTLAVKDPGTYWVDISLNGCTVRDTIQVLYGTEPLCGPLLVFHNAFNPHSTVFENQSFYLHNPNVVDKLEIFIFNRWGELVFHSTDKNFYWTGEYKGEIISDLYTYRVEYCLSSEQVKPSTLIGEIYLIN